MKTKVVTTVMLTLIIASIAINVTPVSAATEIPITDVYELQDMKNNLAGNYVLMNDIDCSDTVNWNGGAGFEPVGQSSPYFTGSFDGKGHIITGLYINRASEDNVGLFGFADGAEINNVGLEDVDINGRGNVGALVGRYDEADAAECYATGRVSGSFHTVGGLIGVSYLPAGIIENCYAKVDVTSHPNNWGGTGGLVGFNFGIIRNCYATGTVGDGWFVGGLVGYTYSGIIENSFATGSVTGWYFEGGLVGRNGYWGPGPPQGATITNCYYNNHAGNPSVGIGYGPGDCTAIGNNEAYFYDSSNPPMSSWDFINIWTIDEGVGHPYLICVHALENMPIVIEELNLQEGIETSLLSTVNNAMKSLEKGNEGAAVNQLQAFINKVEAQRGKKISEEAADILIAYANIVIAMWG